MTGGASAGVGFAVAAYLLWGLVPIYWKTLPGVPVDELTAWRALWSAVVGASLVIVARHAPALRAVLRAPRLLLPLALSAALLGVNWLVFIHAMATDRVAHTSLGYYVNPLVSVALGFLLLGERLRPAQTAAVGIAAAGVGWWTFTLGGLPWIAAVLAGTFALYGLVRKLVPVQPAVGFCLEMLLLLPFAVAYLWLRPGLAVGAGDQAWVALSGVITAAPLLCFASAARRLPLFALGLFQYIAPTLTLCLAVWVYGEGFTRDHAVSFGSVIAALLIFSADSFAAARRAATQSVASS